MALIIYKRQKQILEFISQFIQTNGTAPTLRQIADAIGVNSLATVHEHLETLQAKGLIKRKAGKRNRFQDSRPGKTVKGEREEDWFDSFQTSGIRDAPREGK